MAELETEEVVLSAADGREGGGARPIDRSRRRLLRSAAWAMSAALVAPLSVMARGAAAQTASDESYLRNLKSEFPKGQFERRAVPLDDFFDATHRDGVPSIDHPRFAAAKDPWGVVAIEPVVSVVIGGEARAYPFQILTWHEVVNDIVGGVPIAVSYGPQTSAVAVYDRRVGGATLEFGVTGRMRLANIVLYDRETESWWQQYTGEAIVGAMTGARLKALPMRIESLARFQERQPAGQVQIPSSPAMRQYGHNPYPNYDTREGPGRYFKGALPKDVAPMARVVVVGGEAWTLDLVRARKTVASDDLTLSWQPGQASALDTVMISSGRDIGNVVVQRKTAQGLVDVPYMVSFAFAFRAFNPEGRIRTS